jgi:hypothetical protein
MQDLIYIYTGNIAIFGLSVPTVWLITGGFLLLAAGKRSATLTAVAGILLFTSYFLPMMAVG